MKTMGNKVGNLENKANNVIRNINSNMLIYVVISIMSIFYIISKSLEKEYNIFLITLVLLINVPEFYNSFPSYYGNEKIFYFMNPFNTLYPFVYYYIIE